MYYSIRDLEQETHKIDLKKDSVTIFINAFTENGNTMKEDFVCLKIFQMIFMNYSSVLLTNLKLLYRLTTFYPTKTVLYYSNCIIIKSEKVHP